ncbi:hypothetical protein [Eisenibacter elegans]|uniref:hypothetical protein n=1 Tax=Eisenibacter elegans TaxID=997 RepID=UPI00047B2A16|nr:hypothetical protein [Eisenibacter elegans]
MRHHLPTLVLLYSVWMMLGMPLLLAQTALNWNLQFSIPQSWEKSRKSSPYSQYFSSKNAEAVMELRQLEKGTQAQTNQAMLQLLQDYGISTQEAGSARQQKLNNNHNISFVRIDHSVLRATGTLNKQYQWWQLYVFEIDHTQYLLFASEYFQHKPSIQKDVEAVILSIKTL